MLYISELLENRYPSVGRCLKQVTEIGTIPKTKDIWVRDFMPIRNRQDEWILFQYFPKYLQNPKYRSLITDNKDVCSQMGLECTYSSLILDGGSVVYRDMLYFVSERVLKDNAKFSQIQIRDILISLFKTDQVILLPEEPNDFTGHLDGVLVILDHKTILMNDGQDEYNEQLRKTLMHYGFEVELLPYSAHKNRTYQSAKGVYMNYVADESHICVPVFGEKTDEVVLKRLSSLYPAHSITPIDCNELAKEGGLLHCISW
ncbi:agmatine deiminase family protein [Sphingobacterium sp. xlx-130]|uniref:agmatine deiminase family protein n=1 Tax=Sphingobacterium sp. xlx-130 TaxID=2654323 RepID=UPI0013DC9034|nr:agmatine deiminase family protein [Sphingobacterium sp. xlx-130]